jgi:AraC-like DNA-binding protein
MRTAISFHPFPVAGVEAMAACTDHAFPRHTHDHHGIGVVRAGGHRSWSDRGEVEAGPGELIAVNPGEVHDGRAVGNRPRSWKILYLDPKVLGMLCADINEGSSAEFWFDAPVFTDARVRSALDEAFSFVTKPDSDVGGVGAEGALLTLVAALQCRARQTLIERREVTACIARVRKRLDDDPAASPTLVDLARELGVSRYQFLRAFVRQVGITPHAYLVQRRVTLARRLIRAGRSLAEAATLAGFCDQSHLTRCFVRHLGVTPQRYATLAK